MISVLLCTYNGSEYIERQLKSLLEQTRLPDEVIIQDDYSTDDTVAICEQFIVNNGLNWTLVKNQQNLGYRKNFITGLKKTSQEIVFLCDQDDIWQDNKIEIMSQEMEVNKSIMSLASTMDIIDEEDRITEKHVDYPFKKKGSVKQITEKEFYKFVAYSGMTMAVRRELIDIIDLQHSDVITHDVYCNYYATRLDGLYFLDKVLTKRRSIGLNTSAIIKEKELVKYDGNERTREVNNILKSYELFSEVDKSIFKKESAILDKYIKSMRVRNNYLTKHNIGKYLKGLWPVCRSFGIKAWLKDGQSLCKKHTIKR
ncbi:MAG: glycosyltransferase [Eubacterium sp.]|nr:glycosyltransferase [Eubacterium sp.]